MKKASDKIKRRLTIKVPVLAILLISIISVISALGVSTPYWNTNPLKLQPGESTIVTLGLQNLVGTENVSLRANITKGSEIATIIDEDLDYFIPLGSEDVTVNIEVKIPQNAEVNKVQDIEVSFLQVSSGEGGGFFTVASAFTQRIPVLVVGEPTESAVYGQKPEKLGVNIVTWAILALIILGIIVAAVIIKKKRQ